MPGRSLRPRTGSSSRAGAPPSVEILDIAFHRASLATPKGKTKPERDRRRAELKIVRAAATTVRHLRLEARPLSRPPLPPFDRALIDGRFGDGVLDRSLTRLRRAEERIRGLAREAERAAHRASGSEELGDQIRAYYGRLSSFVREIDPDLVRVREMAQYLRERPRVDEGHPTLVIAGFPNVGKSSLVGRLSTAHPKVASYPFTTLSIALGHADLGFDRLQVVDTPGVLGRARRSNPAEAEAHTTVQRAATVVLFVIDPTGTSGYTPEEQEELLARWQQEFPTLTIVPVETKADLLVRPNGRRHVSSVTGEGLDELLRWVRDAVKPRGELPPVQEEIVEADTDPIADGDEVDEGPQERPRSRPARRPKGGRR